MNEQTVMDLNAEMDKFYRLAAFHDQKAEQHPHKSSMYARLAAGERARADRISARLDAHFAA